MLHILTKNVTLHFIQLSGSQSTKQHNQFKMKRIILILLFTTLISNLWAQHPSSQWARDYDLDNFVGLKSEGPVPSDLRLSLDELYTLDKQRVRDYTDGKLPNSDKVLSASYHINKLMASGRILYGDPLTHMVERIADTLLKDYPTLRNELRFYTIKSPEVNAFATGQGMVFVCTGLIAQVQDEAQLAFVISHEIIHYLRKHSLEHITRDKHDSDDIEAETREMRDFIKFHNRSREMESEADSLGLTMFYLNSPFSKDVTEGFFDVLQYSYLPFDEVPFATAFFNTPYFKMPSEYFLDEVAPITARDDYDDSLSTHPNILKRRTRTAAIIGGQNGGVHYLMTSREEFDFIRTLARMECIRQDLIHAEYARAFYDCYLMQCVMPNNHYVNRAMCQSLYGLSKHKTYTNNSSAVGDYKDFEGEVQQSYYFFRKVKREDLALLTAHSLYTMHNRYPNDKQISDMCSDIFADLYEKYNYTTSSFASSVDTASNDTVDNSHETKYQRLKKKKKNQQMRDARTYAFTDLFLSDPSFERYLDSHLRTHETPENNFTSNERQIIYNPSYLVFNRHLWEINYRKSYHNEEHLFSQIAKAASANGIASENFSDQSLHETTSSDRYNEFVDIVEWVTEYWNTEGNFDMLNSMQPTMDLISQRYNVSSINMTKVFNINHLGRKVSGFSFYLILVPPLLPAVIESLASATEITIVQSMQIDAHNGHTLKKSTYTYNYQDEDARVTNAIYRHFRTALDSTCKNTGYLGSHFLTTLTGTIGIGSENIEWNSFPRRSVIGLGANLSVGYAVSNKDMFEVSVGYLPTSYNETVNSDLYSIFINYRNFLKNDIAPFGRSFAVGLGYADYQLAEAVDGYEKHNPYFGIHLDIGRNYMISKQFSLGYTLQYNLIVNPKTMTENSFNSQVFLYNVFRIGLTLGFLPHK